MRFFCTKVFAYCICFPAIICQINAGQINIDYSKNPDNNSDKLIRFSRGNATRMSYENMENTSACIDVNDVAPNKQDEEEDNTDEQNPKPVNNTKISNNK